MKQQPESEHDEAALVDARIEELRHTHAIVGDSSFSEMIARFHAAFHAVLDRAVAEEIIDWLRDEGFVGGGVRPALAQASNLEILTKFKEICQDIWNEEPTLKNYARFRVLNQPFLDDITGNQNPSEFAKCLVKRGAGIRFIASLTLDGETAKVQWDTQKEFIIQEVTKQAVVKSVDEARLRLGNLGIKLNPRADERDEAACANMKKAREGQLLKLPNPA